LRQEIRTKNINNPKYRKGFNCFFLLFNLNIRTNMQKVSEFIDDREIISDNDMDTSSDDYMEDDEQEEMEIEHFNLSEEWIEKIRQIGNDSISCVREYMDVDLIKEENEDFFGDAFLFAESMSLKKRHTALNVKTRGSYRKYTPKQVEKLFDLIIEEGFTTKAVALATGINVRTTQNYVKTYNNDPERQLPGSYSKPRGRPRAKLTEEHSKFLVDYIEKNTTAILDELKLKLCEKFEGLKISISAIHRHLVHKHNITLKKLEKIPAARNSDRVIALRKAIIEQYKSEADMDFSKNCVFIDEAGFNLHTQRNHGRSLKGTPAKSTVLTGKGVTFTILGAISQAGIINIGVKKPESASKKRKADGKEIKINGKVGTRAEHFLAYLNNVMNTLDKNNIKGQDIVMDNAPIHKPKVIKALIEERGHKCIYLPPYSPFLNPIEEFWSKIKAGVRRTPLTADDRLTDRM
jgi:transposase